MGIEGPPGGLHSSVGALGKGDSRGHRCSDGQREASHPSLLKLST